MDKSVEKTYLSLKDMAKLVNVYDAVKKLHIALFGAVVAFPRSRGIIGSLDCVLDVIYSGICAEFKQLSDEEEYQRVSCILDDTAMTPEQRAGKLLGMD